MLTNTCISILGCGWLGLPLAKLLINNGHEVKGSSTTLSKLQELKEIRITPYLIDLPASSPTKDFFATDILIINIPPKTRSKDKDHHLNCIQSLVPHIQPDTKVIYISATSVYPDFNRKITEEDALDKSSDRAAALWQVEELLNEKYKGNLTIIRMGGLLGYERIPGRYFAGKEVSNALQKVNYIHRDDAISLIEAVISNKIWGEIFNGVAPLHPTRGEVFLQNAKEIGFDPPIISDLPTNNPERFISADKIVQKIDYSFIYPDPLQFYYTY